MMDVFLGYKSEEVEKARAIKTALEDLGLSVFFDKDNLQAGQPWTEDQNIAINTAKCVVILWSKAAASSVQVKAEANRGINLKTYIPAQIEPLSVFDLSPAHDLDHRPNLSRFLETAQVERMADPEFLNLLEAIGAKVGRPGLRKLAKSHAAGNLAEKLKWAQEYWQDPMSGKVVASVKDGLSADILADEQKTVAEQTAKLESLKSRQSSELQEYKEKLSAWSQARKDQVAAWLSTLDRAGTISLPEPKSAPTADADDVKAELTVQVKNLQVRLAEAGREMSAAKDTADAERKSSSAEIDRLRSENAAIASELLEVRGRLEKSEGQLVVERKARADADIARSSLENQLNTLNISAARSAVDLEAAKTTIATERNAAKKYREQADEVPRLRAKIAELEAFAAKPSEKLPLTGGSTLEKDKAPVAPAPLKMRRALVYLAIALAFAALAGYALRRPADPIVARTSAVQQTAPTPSRGNAPETERSPPKANQLPVDCQDCPEMVALSGGNLPNGSAVKAFAIGKFEVSQGQYKRFLTAKGRPWPKQCLLRTLSDPAPTNTGTPETQTQINTKIPVSRWTLAERMNFETEAGLFNLSAPMVCITHQDAIDYAQWLSEVSGQRYRLPNGAEWEFAARAGSTMASPWSSSCNNPGGPDPECDSCLYANLSEPTAGLTGGQNTEAACNDSAVRARSVGQYRSNGFGLHDMFGNVAEFLNDCRPALSNRSETDAAAATGMVCPVRGGSWAGSAASSNAVKEGIVSPITQIETVGFRVVREM